MRAKSYALLLSAIMASCVVSAQPQHREHGDRGRGRGGPPQVQLDSRYHHDRYYPPPGQVMRELPRGSMGIRPRDRDRDRGRDWFVHGGVWFHRDRDRFVIARPPRGIVAPFLPPAYTTLWVGGVPYYYANGVYYSPMPGEGYAVVAPPDGVVETQPGVGMPGSAPVIYPRNGQSQAQLDADAADCAQGASAQTVGAPAYWDIFEACMDDRGYTVR